MKKLMVCTGVLLFGVALAVARQQSISDEGGRVLALETAWNHALEAKDTKALDMLLANTMVSIDVDGSISTKGEFLASIKSPSYQPSQAVTEQTNVHDAAVVVGVFRVKGTEKGKPYLRRERFVDTWIKVNGTWQCVATLVQSSRRIRSAPIHLPNPANESISARRPSCSVRCARFATPLPCSPTPAFPLPLRENGFDPALFKLTVFRGFAA